MRTDNFIRLPSPDWVEHNHPVDNGLFKGTRAYVHEMARVLLPGTLNSNCDLESLLELLFKQVEERSSAQPLSPAHRVFDSEFQSCNYNETTTHINVFQLDEVTGRSIRVDTREIDVKARSVKLVSRYGSGDYIFLALLPSVVLALILEHE